MNTSDIRTLFAYNAWANQRLLDAARTLPSDQFTCDLHSSFGSIRGTLLHIITGEWKWLQFWMGKPYDVEFAPEDYPNVASLEARWVTVRAEQQQFLDELTDDALRGTRLVRGAQRPLSDALQHVLSHSTHHRGQVSALLRQSGCVPPCIDFLVFRVETGDAAEQPSTRANR
jgi:uncharacterized damage-inducible protein DinB